MNVLAQDFEISKEFSFGYRNTQKSMHKMVAITKNCSITQEQNDFLDKNPNFSPSKMLQTQIVQVMENHSDMSKEIVRLQGSIIKLNRYLAEANERYDVLEKKSTGK